jgi:ABC-type branched-subunit amino acid transport system ATPase component
VPAVLVVDELTVEYQGAIRALRQVSITVADAEVVALVGNNGAGKTTLLRAVSQNLEAHRGRVVHGDITFDGRSLRGWDRAACVRAGLVQVPEGRRIFGTLTVEENLKLAAAASGHRRPRRPACAVSTSCSHASASDAHSAACCCPAANSRCSPSAGRSSPSRSC